MKAVEFEVTFANSFVITLRTVGLWLRNLMLHTIITRDKLFFSCPGYGVMNKAVYTIQRPNCSS